MTVLVQPPCGSLSNPDAAAAGTDGGGWLNGGRKRRMLGRSRKEGKRRIRVNGNDDWGKVGNERGRQRMNTSWTR